VLAHRADAQRVLEQLVDLAVGGHAQVAEPRHERREALGGEPVGEVQAERRLAATGRPLHHDEVPERRVTEAVEHRVDQRGAPAAILGERVHYLIAAEVAPAQRAALGLDVHVGERERLTTQHPGLPVLPTQPGTVGRQVVGPARRRGGQAAQAVDDNVERVGAELDALQVTEDVVSTVDEPVPHRDDRQTRLRLARREDRPLPPAPVRRRRLPAHHRHRARALQQPPPELIGPAGARLDVHVAQHPEPGLGERCLQGQHVDLGRAVAPLVTDEYRGPDGHAPPSTRWLIR
jgi:hypothetical protein